MKTKQIISVALLIGAAVMTSCQKQPDAKISASKTIAEINEAITFSHSSSNTHSVLWDFGDGGTSTAESPSHTWINAGSYTVTLMAFSKNEKKKDKDNVTITITTNPCANVNCLNGGTCANGICNCPGGYSGTNCETYNPCYNVTCLNGGTCANGQCVCLQGYTGANCSQQITPTKITITKVQVTRFPATDGGGGWDLTSGPDIYPKILLVSTVIWDSPTYYTDANPSSIYDFNPSPYINLNNPTSQYTIQLYDYDTADPDDYMGGIYFTPYNSSNGFPSVLTIDAGGSVAFKLYVTYTW